MDRGLGPVISREFRPCLGTGHYLSPGGGGGGGGEGEDFGGIT